MPKFGYLLGGAEPTNFCVLLVIFRFGVVPCTLAVHGPRAELSLATTRSTRNNNSNSSFVVEATCFNFWWQFSAILSEFLALKEVKLVAKFVLMFKETEERVLKGKRW